MSLFSPVRETTRGLATYLAGVRWLRRHPRYLLLLTVPGILGALIFVGGMSLFIAESGTLGGWLLHAPRPEQAWTAVALYRTGEVLLYIAATILVALGSLLFMNIAASPIYEVISVAVERDVTGREPASPGLSLKVMLVEAKKVLLIFGASILLLLIPGAHVISTLICAFLVGWDFFDYPLARRGWSLGARLRLVFREFWSVLGFGLWLLIPFAQIVMLPLAVAGGTLLNLEALRKRELLSSYDLGEDV